MDAVIGGESRAGCRMWRAHFQRELRGCSVRRGAGAQRAAQAVKIGTQTPQ